MSIVRVGLAETKNYSDGYDRIFGTKEDKSSEPKPEQKQGSCQQQTPCQDKPAEAKK